MPSKKKKYNARFPAGRIKKIMQSDEEVGKVAQAVPIIISRTLELFVESMLTKTMRITNARNAKTLSPSHLKQCIMSENRFDFLRELVKNVPDINVAEEQMLFENTSPSIATPASLPSTMSNSINDNNQSTSGTTGVNTSIINNNQFKNTLQQSLTVSNDDNNSIKNGNKRITTQTTTIPLTSSTSINNQMKNISTLTSQPMKSAWHYTKQQSLDCGSNYSLSPHTATNSATSLSSSLASSSTSQINKIINPNYYTEISDTSVIRHTSNSQDNCLSTDKCISDDNIDGIVRPPKLTRFDSAPANLSQSTSMNNVSLSNNATEDVTPILKIDLSNMTFGSKDIDDCRSANSATLSTLNVSQKRQLLPPLTPISTQYVDHYNIPITKNLTTQNFNLNSSDASSTVPSTSGTSTTTLQPSIVNSEICNSPLVKINYCDLLNEANNNFSPSNSSPSSLLIKTNLSAAPSPLSPLSEPLICTASSTTSIKSKSPTNSCKSTNIFRSLSTKTSSLLEMDEDYDNI